MRYLQGRGRLQAIYNAYVPTLTGAHKRVPHLHLLWLVNQLYKLYGENGVDNWYHVSLFIPEALKFQCPQSAPKSLIKLFAAIPHRIHDFYSARHAFLKAHGAHYSSDHWHSFLKSQAQFTPSYLDDVMDDALTYAEIMEHRQRYKATKKTANHKVRLVQEAMA